MKALQSTHQTLRKLRWEREEMSMKLGWIIDFQPKKEWRWVSKVIHLVEVLQRQEICVNDINTFIRQWFTQTGNLAKIKINCLLQRVMSITGPSVPSIIWDVDVPENKTHQQWPQIRIYNNECNGWWSWTILSVTLEPAWCAASLIPTLGTMH